MAHPPLTDEHCKLLRLVEQGPRTMSEAPSEGRSPLADRGAEPRTVVLDREFEFDYWILSDLADESRPQLVERVANDAGETEIRITDSGREALADVCT